MANAKLIPRNYPNSHETRSRGKTDKAKNPKIKKVGDLTNGEGLC